jgi:hypothetical protein
VGRDANHIARFALLINRNIFAGGAGQRKQITAWGAGDLPDGSALVRDILPGHMNGNPLKPDQLIITGFAEQHMRHTSIDR